MNRNSNSFPSLRPTKHDYNSFSREKCKYTLKYHYSSNHVKLDKDYCSICVEISRSVWKKFPRKQNILCCRWRHTEFFLFYFFACCFVTNLFRCYDVFVQKCFKKMLIWITFDNFESARARVNSKWGDCFNEFAFLCNRFHRASIRRKNCRHSFMSKVTLKALIPLPSSNFEKS